MWTAGDNDAAMEDAEEDDEEAGQPVEVGKTGRGKELGSTMRRRRLRWS